ncbi:MAG TPA: hypothetical protein VLK84_31425 [Longimicrobium sp.]|nr:hypothetical protein [Longimicrobium sp.]
MRPSRPILLASAAAAVLIAAACSGDASAPAGPTLAGAAPSPTAGLFSASADTTGTDSIMPGYGPNCDPKHLEIPYDPTPPPEYIVCPDTTAAERGLIAAGDTTPPPPKPAPAPAPTPAPAPKPAPTPTPTDSVVAGYGNENTGGYP